MVLRIEPWGEEYPVAGGDSRDVVFDGPGPADIGVDVESSVVTIHGRVGSVLDGQGLRFPKCRPVFASEARCRTPG